MEERFLHDHWSCCRTKIVLSRPHRLPQRPFINAVLCHPKANKATSGSILARVKILLPYPIIIVWKYSRRMSEGGYEPSAKLSDRRKPITTSNFLKTRRPVRPLPYFFSWPPPLSVRCRSGIRPEKTFRSFSSSNPLFNTSVIWSWITPSFSVRSR